METTHIILSLECDIFWHFFSVLLFALHFEIKQQWVLPEEIIVSELQVTAKIKEMNK